MNGEGPGVGGTRLGIAEGGKATDDDESFMADLGMDDGVDPGIAMRSKQSTHFVM